MPESGEQGDRFSSALQRALLTRESSTGEKDQPQALKPAAFSVKLSCEHNATTFPHVFTDASAAQRGLQPGTRPSQPPSPEGPQPKPAPQRQRDTRASSVPRPRSPTPRTPASSPASPGTAGSPAPQLASRATERRAAPLLLEPQYSDTRNERFAEYLARNPKLWDFFFSFTPYSNNSRTKTRNS